MKLWDAKRAKLVYHWPKLHERHTFLQPSTRGFGGVFRVIPKKLPFSKSKRPKCHVYSLSTKLIPCPVLQAAVTDIQVVSDGFLTCGGDGIVKYVRFQGNPMWTTN